MNKLIKANEKQIFMGIEIPVIYGGFGESCKVVTAKTIAEIHGTRLADVNATVGRMIERGRLKSAIDYIDCLSETVSLRDFAKENDLIGSNRTQNVYVLSERGYCKLIKAMDDDKSWDVMEKFVDDYFQMKNIILSNEELKAKYLLAIYIGGQEAVVASKQLTDLEVKEATIPLLNTIEEQKPSVEFADTVTKSCDNILMRDMAKLLCDKKINIGEKRLYKLLRNKSVLMDRNEPYQSYVDRGYFFVKESTYNTPYGEKLNRTTLVTPKGQIWLVSKAKKWLDGNSNVN